MACSYGSRITELLRSESIGLDQGCIVGNLLLATDIVPAQHLANQLDDSPGSRQTAVRRLHCNVGSAHEHVVKVECPLVTGRIHGLDFQVLWRLLDRLGELRAVGE